MLTIAAGFLRAALYTGFFGSDEVTYTEAAVRILRGDWTASNYIGALRYGVNLPVAGSMWLFGVSEFSANLWPFMCSVGEVLAVYAVGWICWGRIAAAFAGAVVAAVPLHVHFAGRLMADAPLALLITLSFAFFLLGERSKDYRWFLACGLACGATYWIKESPIIYCAAFGIYALLNRKWNWQWNWALGAAALVILANMALMWIVAGDPLHIFRVMRSVVTRFAAWNKETSPWYYFDRLGHNLANMID